MLETVRVAPCCALPQDQPINLGVFAQPGNASSVANTAILVGFITCCPPGLRLLAPSGRSGASLCSREEEGALAGIAGQARGFLELRPRLLETSGPEQEVAA